MHVCYIFVVASPAVNYVKEYLDFSLLFQKKKRKKVLSFHVMLENSNTKAKKTSC